MRVLGHTWAGVRTSDLGSATHLARVMGMSQCWKRQRSLKTLPRPKSTLEHWIVYPGIKLTLKIDN